MTSTSLASRSRSEGAETLPRVDSPSASPEHSAASPESPAGSLNGHAANSVAARLPPATEIDWEALRLHRSHERKSLMSPILSSRHSPLLWGWPVAPSASDDAESSAWNETARWIERMAKAERAPIAKAPKWTTNVAAWLATTDAAPSAPLAHQFLAAAYSLPALSRLVAADVWRSLCERLLAAATDGRSVATDIWTDQLLAGELPRVLASAFHHWEQSASLGVAASAAVARGMERALDAEGMPRSEFLNRSRALLALWTRSLACGGRDEHGGWSDEIQTRYLWFVRQSLRLSRPDGSPVFASCQRAGDADLLRAASEMISRNRRDRARYDSMRRGKLPRSTAAKAGKLPACAVHSEASRLAVMRSDWSADAPKFVVDYGGPTVRCELSVGDRLVLSGAWQCEAVVNGQPAPQPTSWQNVCWISDEDVDYLEIESRLSPSLRVQRQAVVARKDGFVYLADVLLADSPASLECRTQWTAATGTHVRLARETREGQWMAPTPRGLLLPLALPEWRLDPRGGEFSAADGSILLTRRSTAVRTIYSPLFIDLQRGRCKKGATWRQLTIAETRVPVPGDAAAAYRVQSGNEQWLFYRALDGRGNRTVLGHNLVSEFLAARFDRSGKTTAVVEVE